MNPSRYMPTILAVGTALAVALTPGPLDAQEADQRIRAALQQAREAGVPAGLLERKAAEGRAKGVPAGRIADAIQRRLDGLTRAQRALAGAGDVDHADLAVAADALEAGVSEAVLESIAETAPRERRAVAIAALGHLVGQGMAPAEALARVEVALARGPTALANLPGRTRGRPPTGTPVGEGAVPAGIPAPGETPGSPDRPGGPPGGQPTGIPAGT